MDDLILLKDLGIFEGDRLDFKLSGSELTPLMLACCRGK